MTIIEQDYDLAVVESKKQNKLLLIDFYFTSCAPCKVLDTKVFKNNSVSEEIGKSFILLKYNVEKPTKDRLELKHHINAFPTTIVLNQDQLIFHRKSGVSSSGIGDDVAQNFMKFLDEAVLKVSKNEYFKGISNSVNLAYPKFLERYSFGGENKLDETEAKNYWETTDDRFSEVSFAMLFLFYYELPDEIKSFFLANKNKYAEFYGKEDTFFLQNRIIRGSFNMAVVKTDRASFNLAAQWAKENYDAIQATNTIRHFEKIMSDQERIKKRRLSKNNPQKKAKG